MKLYKVRGGSEKLVHNRAYNIGVGISLGNKWFSAENILGLIEWSLENTKDFVVVYIADSIHAINIEVRYRKSPEKSKEKAIKMGDKILKEVKELVRKRFTDEQLKRIHYVRWYELLTPEFQKKVDFLYKKYKTDVLFRNKIINLTNDFLEREERIFSHEDKVKLGEYIIEELPEILNRVPANDLVFDAHVYPFDGKLPELVDDIQRGIIFPEIKKEIMDTEPKVFLEVR